MEKTVLHYQIDHETRLEFPVPIHEHHCELRMLPREDAHQHVKFFTIELDPPAPVLSYTDTFGNHVTHFSLMAPHQHLTTRIRSEVETTLENPFAFPLLTPAEEAVWMENALKKDPSLLQYLVHQSASTPLWSTLKTSAMKPPERDHTLPVQTSVFTAMLWVASVLKYQPGVTQVDTPLAEVLRLTEGVCQDFAHALISLLRHWGIPARYVMGYLDPGLTANQAIQGEQASHAWVEALIPNAGWRGFDATHQLVANDTYIPVAVGRDAHDAAPQRGSFKGSQSSSSPRITLLVSRQNQ